MKDDFRMHATSLHRWNQWGISRTMLIGIQFHVPLRIVNSCISLK